MRARGRPSIAETAYRVLGTKACDRGTEVSFGGVPERFDERVPFERLLHDASLNPFAAAVNEPHLAQTSFVCGVDVLLHDRFDVARQEGMQIETILDRKMMSHGAAGPYFAGRMALLAATNRGDAEARSE